MAWGLEIGFWACPILQFRVPKYLEREATIAFGLTFKNLIILGGGALVLFVLYYLVPSKVVFAVIFVLFAGLFAFFSFVKIKGQSVFEVFSHAFGFLFAPRTYLWRKKEGIYPIKVIKKKEESDKQKHKTVLKIAPRSRLHEISSKIDVGKIT